MWVVGIKLGLSGLVPFSYPAIWLALNGFLDWRLTWISVLGKGTGFIGTADSCLRVSITVINTMTKSKWGAKGLLRLRFRIIVSSLREARTGIQDRS